MPPLVGIAISMLPGLAKRVASNVLPDVEDRITQTVRDVLGTDDPEKAEELLADPKVAAQLRVRLAQIEAEAEVRQAEIDQERRRTELEEFKAGTRDTEDARALLKELVTKDSLFAWGPVVVSVMVVAGFFITLTLLVFRALPPDSNEQMMNIIVGALTAGFATVISFWLGSSQGSRFKDETARAQNVVTLKRDADQMARETKLLETVTQQSQVAPQAQGTTAAPPPKAKNPRQFHECVDIILGHEGGFANHPKDPGGATNLGITHITLASFRGVPKVTPDEVRALTVDEAKEIYRLNYWNKLNCDSLPAGVDLVVFDHGVNAGPGRAAKILQDIVSSKVDGVIGTRTLDAVKSFGDAKEIVAEFGKRRQSYYESLSTFSTFGGGWTRRVQETQKVALGMIPE